MRFRKSAPRVLILAVGLVIGALTLGANYLFSTMTSAVERSQIELMRSIIAVNLENAASDALARAEMTAADETVRRLLAQQDRPGLIAHSEAMFRDQRDKYGVDQVAFHTAAAISFLRLQNTALYGDDLNRFRPVVVAVNRDRVARKGMEIARTGPAIFGVTPIRDLAGNHIGSVEFGMDLGALLDRLKAAYGLELTLFVDEAPLATYATGIKPGVISEQNRVGSTMRLQSTNWALMSGLVNTADLRIHDDQRDWVRKAGGVPYGVVLQPLRNISGETMGAVVIARSFEPTRGAAGRTTVLQWLFAVLGFLVVAGVILVVVRGWLVRPLDTMVARFATVGTGQRSEPDEDDRFLCSELAALAAQHRRIADLTEGKLP